MKIKGSSSLLKKIFLLHRTQAGVGARDERFCQLVGGGEQVDDGSKRERRSFFPLGMSASQNNPVPGKAHVNPRP